MGSLITLRLGRLEVDWGKNNIFTNHCWPELKAGARTFPAMPPTVLFSGWRLREVGIRAPNDRNWRVAVRLLTGSEEPMGSDLGALR